MSQIPGIINGNIYIVVHIFELARFGQGVGAQPVRQLVPCTIIPALLYGLSAQLIFAHNYRQLQHSPSHTLGQIKPSLLALILSLSQVNLTDLRPAVNEIITRLPICASSWSRVRRMHE